MSIKMHSDLVTKINGRRRLTFSRRVTCLFSGAIIAGSMALALGQADPALAAACGGAVAAGSNCTLIGTIGITAGTLTLTSPSSLSWSTTLTGLNQSLFDSTSADQQYTVTDATGSGAGWHVTTSATTFTNGTFTLANSGTFSTNGSLTSATATNGPSATCTGICTLPTNPTTYPVAITTAPTAPTPVTIFDNTATFGLGQVVIGGHSAANPVGWWVQVPSNASAGSYTSTITMAIIAGP